MEDASKRLARRVLRQQVRETTDPLVALTLSKRAPSLRPGIQLSTHVAPAGSGYHASLVYSSGYTFYKVCLRSDCKSRAAAKLLAEYHQNALQLKDSHTRTRSNRNLNTN